MIDKVKVKAQSELVTVYEVFDADCSECKAIVYGEMTGLSVDELVLLKEALKA